MHEYPDDFSFGASTDGRIEMAQEEVDAIIRNKRKVRDPKACYACHRRKVKCDRNLPCDSCVKRDHPELCSYERPTKKRRIAFAGAVANSDGALSDGHDYPSQSGPNITVPREQWERLNQELQELKASSGPSYPNLTDTHSDHEDTSFAGPVSPYDEEERHGIHVPSAQMGTTHLGSRSVLAYMMALGRSQSTQDAARTLLEENVLPKLGLDNESVTYPFVDLWSSGLSVQDVHGLCHALPDDALCKELFVAYRDVACTIYPVVPDCAAFERQMDYMLANRAHQNRNQIELDPDTPLGVSLSWLALCFAVLASGAQSTDRPGKERELTSQVYICCSYQALRMSNFMTYPNLDTIAASLVIGNVLAYNMNPGVAYIFLGMTLRMAFTMGLQTTSQNFSEQEQWTRSRIWWALAWQDSHYAVSYDRPTSSVLCSPEIPYDKNSRSGNRSYAESMYAIIRLTQEIIRERIFNPKPAMTWAMIQRYVDDVATIVTAGVPHLRDRKKCTKMTQHLERLALKLHASYIISELCRPALKETTDAASGTPVQSPSAAPRRAASQSPSNSAGVDTHMPLHLRRECVRALEGTVEAYVELHSLSQFAARSWVGIQRSISAAFLLGTLHEAQQEPRIRDLLREIERVIFQRTNEDASFGAGSPGARHGGKNTTSAAPAPEPPHWARSMNNSLHALGKLNAALATNAQAGNHLLGAYQSNANVGSNSGNIFAMQGQPINGNYSLQLGGSRNQVQPVIQMKQEPIFPGMSSIGLMSTSNTGPITPDSTGSEWNYNNVSERAIEYALPALWC